MKKNDIQAFPRPIGQRSDQYNSFVYCDAQKGMTLRDYFAGQALPSLISIAIKASGANIALQNCPKDAYIFADAMLAEREKGEGQ